MIALSIFMSTDFVLLHQLGIRRRVSSIVALSLMMLAQIVVASLLMGDAVVYGIGLICIVKVLHTIVSYEEWAISTLRCAAQYPISYEIKGYRDEHEDQP